VRRPHSERGMISPGERAPVVEETGLIEGLGGMILRRSCMDLKSWPDEGVLSRRTSRRRSSAPAICSRCRGRARRRRPACGALGDHDRGPPRGDVFAVGKGVVDSQEDRRRRQGKGHERKAVRLKRVCRRLHQRHQGLTGALARGVGNWRQFATMAETATAARPSWSTAAITPSSCGLSCCSSASCFDERCWSTERSRARRRRPRRSQEMARIGSLNMGFSEAARSDFENPRKVSNKGCTYYFGASS